MLENAVIESGSNAGGTGGRIYGLYPLERNLLVLNGAGVKRVFLRLSPDETALYREKIKPEKIRLALKYVDERTFAVDISIIFQTVATLFRTRV